MLAAGLIVLAGVAAYHNSFVGPFFFDDVAAIVENRTICRLWPIWQVLSPPSNGETVSGRPVLNISLAINYAISGLSVWSYHATNLAIHIGAALLLMGILRRTFLTPSLRDRFGKAALPLALASALLWTVHPLQTESVTYIIQRAESLMGFLYLLTLYCVIRAARSAKPLCWYLAAVLACLLGMACKEVMFTAPLVVLLYDRTFLAGSFREAWRRRWKLYVGLLATWCLLAYLVLSTGLVGRQSEFGAPDPWTYARTQPGVILDYLQLSVWPSPLCLDYKWPVAGSLLEILPGALGIALVLGITIWGLVANNAWGFLGAWFLLILAPTSSVLPLADLRYEHRMYLPLAAVAVLAVAAGYAFWKRWLPRSAAASARATALRWAAPVVVWVMILLALAAVTVARNRYYRLPLLIYQDTLDKSPENFVAHNNLGSVLTGLGRSEEAIKQYEEALRLKPDYADAHANLGIELAKLGKTAEAVEHYREAWRLKPNFPWVYNHLGVGLASLGKADEAIIYLNQALRLQPDYPHAHYNLARVLEGLGKIDEAIKQYQVTLRLEPGYVEAHSSLAYMLSRVGRIDEAMEHCQEALRLRPHFAEAEYTLSIILLGLGKTDEAIAHCNQAVRLKSDYAEAHNALGVLLFQQGRLDQAVEHCTEALRLKPKYAEAHNTLGALLAQTGRIHEAIEHYRQALQLEPQHVLARENLARLLATIGAGHKTIEEYRAFLQHAPDSPNALNDLAWLLATHEPAEGGDPVQAVQLAERAREVGGQENAQCLDTLAAAYAAACRFDDAMVIAQRALQLAESSAQTALAERIRLRLELYRAGRPYRETPRSAAQPNP